MPEGGIAQPASGARAETTNVAAMNRERKSLTPSRIAFTFVEPAPERRRLWTV
jgi:hypothetical protein